MCIKLLAYINEHVRFNQTSLATDKLCEQNESLNMLNLCDNALEVLYCTINHFANLQTYWKSHLGYFPCHLNQLGVPYLAHILYTSHTIQAPHKFFSLLSVWFILGGKAAEKLY